MKKVLLAFCVLFLGKSIKAQKFRDTLNPEIPIMLDDIHYYTLDREACNTFFKTNFNAKAVKEDGPNPFRFIDFLRISKNQSTINISSGGPFPGIKVGDPKRWERETLQPSKANPPMYGVHWLALNVSSLSKARTELESSGVEIINPDYKLPHTKEPALLCYGPDYNYIVVVENSMVSPSEYKIDHLLILVENLEDNIAFFKDVFDGDLLEKSDGMAVLNVGEHQLILVIPRVLGLNSDEVVKKDQKVFRPNIDHIGFLYKDVVPAYKKAKSMGYRFLSPPIPITYFNKPTRYTFAITFSPDGLQCEMYQEKGRLGPRTNLKE